MSNFEKNLLNIEKALYKCNEDKESMFSRHVQDRLNESMTSYEKQLAVSSEYLRNRKDILKVYKRMIRNEKDKYNR